MPTEWDQARQTLRAELGAMFEIWVAHLRFHGVDGNASPPKVHLVAPNETFRSWIESSCRASVESALRGALGSNDVAVVFWVEGNPLPSLGQASSPEVPHASIPSPAPRPLFPGLPALPGPTSSGGDTAEHRPSVRTAARKATRRTANPLPQPDLFRPPVTLPGPEALLPSSASQTPLPAPCDLPSGKTFQHFVVGGCNQFAHAAASAVADDPSGQRYNPLFIYGGTGLGKTHLMVAVGHHRRRTAPDTRVLYITGEQFTNELIDSLRFKRMAEFRERFRHGVDLLLMDDVQFVSGKERTQEELFHTFEWLRERGKQIVFTADVPPHEIRGLEERLRTRCASGMLADIQPPDQETLAAILHEKANGCGLDLPSEVAAYVAARVGGSIREIEGIVNRLDALSNLYDQALSLPFVRVHLGPFLPEHAPTAEPRDIVRKVCEVFSITTKELYGTQRTQRIVRPRHTAMYLVRKHTGASFPELGRLFHRDHTTVQNGVRRAEKLLGTDLEFRKLVHIIERAIHV